MMEPWGGETVTSEEGIRYQFFTVLVLLGLPTLFGFGVVHLRRGDVIPSLWDLALLFTFIPMMAGLHQVTSAARYMVPVIPLWAVLAGCGLAKCKISL